jgi:hypothetical protein
MTLILALALCLGAPLQTFSPQADALLIHVRIQTDDLGDVDDVAERRESVRHLVAAIAGKKKPGMVLVANPDDRVDVVVNVEGRGVTVPKVVIGLSGGMGSGRPTPAPPVRAAQLHVTFTIANGSDPVAIMNKNRANETESGWKSAADDVAKQLEKWIAEHRAAILKAR